MEILCQANPLMNDSDGDALSDQEELIRYYTNMSAADSDADGLSDYLETLFQCNPNSKDSDFDLLSDNKEVLLETAPNDNDTDEDGLLDGFENYFYNTDPTNPDSVPQDSNADGRPDEDDVFYAIFYGTEDLVSFPWLILLTATVIPAGSILTLIIKRIRAKYPDHSEDDSHEGEDTDDQPAPYHENPGQPCFFCSHPMRYIDKYGRNFCDFCNKYQD